MGDLVFLQTPRLHRNSVVGDLVRVNDKRSKPKSPLDISSVRFVFEMNAPEVAKVSMVGDVVGCRKVAAGGVHAHVVESTHNALHSLVIRYSGWARLYRRPRVVLSIVWQQLIAFQLVVAVESSSALRGTRHSEY